MLQNHPSMNWLSSGTDPQQGSFGRPLQSKGWRDWFDVLLNSGVTGIGGRGADKQGNVFQQPLAIDTLLGEPYTGPVDPMWTAQRNPQPKRQKVRT